MAKVSGIGSNLYVAQYDLSGDVGALDTCETSRAILPVTGIDKGAPERILGRKDGAIAFKSFWNIVSGQAQPVLSALPRADVIASWFQGALIGMAAASMVAKQTNYAPAFGDDGSLVAATSALANGYGLEWGESLTTGKQTFGTGAVNGTSINLGAASSLFGAAAYLHVFSVASGTATFTVQDSDDDLTFLPVAGMAFTGATGPTSQRIQGAINATVRQYVRIAGSGTHGDAVIAVNFVRYLADPSV